MQRRAFSKKLSLLKLANTSFPFFVSKFPAIPCGFQAYYHIKSGVNLRSYLKTLNRRQSCSTVFRHRQVSVETSVLCLCKYFWTASSMSQMEFSADKEKFLSMNLEERRQQYSCKGNYVTLDKIPTWQKYSSHVLQNMTEFGGSRFPKNENLNEKVSIFRGDITVLEIDAIVNAANNALRGGGGVDGAIHKAAGPKLLAECNSLGICPTGDSKISGGYKLPSKYVIHTVGPVGEKPDLLQSCYRTALEVAKVNGVQSIAFPCISTGVFGYPNENAAHVALRTVREWLETNENAVSRIIFCLFLPVDVKIYENLLQNYFPV